MTMMPGDISCMMTDSPSAVRPVAIGALGAEPRVLACAFYADAVSLPHPQQILDKVRAGRRHARSGQSAEDGLGPKVLLRGSTTHFTL